MKKIALLLLLIVIGLTPVTALAQNAESTGEAESVGKEESAGESDMEVLSKKVANPLAQVWNLAFQHNRIKLSGDLIDGSEHISATLFQPVLPVPMGDRYTFFARPVVTFVDAPSSGEISGGTPTHPIVTGTDRTAEFGDLILPIGFGEAKMQGWTWGVGATFILPTANNDLVGSHKYQAGPAGIVIWSSKDWLIGGMLQHWWDIADDNKSDDDPLIAAKHNANLNHTDLQYFIIRHLPRAWQLRASPHITANWENDSSERWTIPVAIGAGKMFMLGPMPVQLMAEVQYPLIAPDAVGQDIVFMLGASFIIKNPFGDR